MSEGLVPVTVVYIRGASDGVGDGKKSGALAFCVRLDESCSFGRKLGRMERVPLTRPSQSSEKIVWLPLKILVCMPAELSSRSA